MPSATITIHPSTTSGEKTSSLSSLLPAFSVPSRGTVAKGAAIVVGVGACYVAYQSFQKWCENWSPLDYFKQNIDEDEKQ